ncbi:MAG: ribonuclease E/G [Marinicaulis sp.]|nr:ribonuclease E/G [Marinicaulis sp.]
MIIDEAQALTAIDVDSAGLTASSPTRLREKMAIAAGYEAAHQISLRNIGGHIAIDFPAMSGQGARERFNEHLKKAMASIEGGGRIWLFQVRFVLFHGAPSCAVTARTVYGSVSSIAVIGAEIHGGFSGQICDTKSGAAFACFPARKFAVAVGFSVV